VQSGLGGWKNRGDYGHNIWSDQPFGRLNDTAGICTIVLQRESGVSGFEQAGVFALCASSPSTLCGTSNSGPRERRVLLTSAVENAIRGDVSVPEIQRVEALLKFSAG